MTSAVSTMTPFDSFSRRRINNSLCCSLFLALLLVHTSSAFSPLQTRSSCLSRGGPPRCAGTLTETTEQEEVSKKSNSEPWKEKVQINLSAANEYVVEHYKHLGYTDVEKGYFLFPNCDASTSTALVDVWNARGNEEDVPTLESDGLSVTSIPVEIKDWFDSSEILQDYVPKLKDELTKRYPNHLHMEIYFPMLRGEGVEWTKTTAPIATRAHVDTDVGAHDMNSLLHLVENNALVPETFPRQDIQAAIESGKRFLIVNAWRHILDSTLKRAPLGVYSTRYSTTSSSAPPRRHHCFPTLQPDPDASRWFSCPSMEVDEVLLFKQFDRRVDRPSDLWHCSLPIAEEEENETELPLRKSFDIRALIVLDEDVPTELDRFCHDRPKPVLDMEESGCFCDKQQEQHEQRLREQHEDSQGNNNKD